MESKVLGYRNGWRYILVGSQVYRNDYSDKEDMGLRWFSTKEGFVSFKKAYGPLYDEAGNTIGE